MAIYGPNPLDSDNAALEYSSILYSIVRRVNYHISGPSNSEVIENSVLGDLYALALLCRDKRRVGKTIAKKQVAEWREKFLAWAEASKDKIPEEHFDGMKQSACQLLSELEEVAVNLPRSMWHTKASLQG